MMTRAVPILTVSDLPRAVERYRAMLGAEILMDHGWIVTLGVGDVQLSLITQDATAPVNPDVSIGVDDVDAVYRIAVERGDEIVHPLSDEEWGVRRFFLRDSDGNVVNVVAHR